MAWVREINRMPNDGTSEILHCVKFDIYRPHGAETMVAAEIFVSFDEGLRFGVVERGCQTGVELFSIGEKIELYPINNEGRPQHSHVIREQRS